MSTPHSWIQDDPPPTPAERAAEARRAADRAGLGALRRGAPSALEQPREDVNGHTYFGNEVYCSDCGVHLSEASVRRCGPS